MKVLIELHTFHALEKHNLLKNNTSDSNSDSDDNQNENNAEANAKIVKSVRSNNNSQLDFGLDQDQANLMIGAIEIKKKTAKDIMIPLEKVYMLEINEQLNKDKTLDLVTQGHSRIPVYEGESKNNITGVLMTKHLVSSDFHFNMSISSSDVRLKFPLVISPDMHLLELLNEFKFGKSHMAIVTKQVTSFQNKFGLNRQNSVIMDKNNNTIKLHEK